MDEEIIKNYILKTIENTPHLVKNRIFKHGKELNKRNDYYRIKKYIDKFLKEYSDDKFIIMPGLRGVGKTTILYQLYNYLITEHNIKYNQILYLNLDRLKDKGNIDLQQYFDIFVKDINEEYYLDNKPLFIFLDETQLSTAWGIVGKIIYDETINVFMIFTGSNALKLTNDNDSRRRALIREINPINFSEYLTLKHFQKFPDNLQEMLIQLLLQGNIIEMKKFEKEVQYNQFIELKYSVKKEWEKYIQTGGFPLTLQSDLIEANERTLDAKDLIIEKDLPQITSITSKTIEKAYPLLDIIALQKPGTLSEDKLSNKLDISKTSVRQLLKALTQSLIIFQIEEYGSPSKRNKKSKEYYYWSTQMKSAIFQNDGGSTTRSVNEINGILLENYVAYSLYRLKIENNYKFNIHFDSRVGGVDFLIKTLTGKIIPIEVGIGKKNKRQIISAINYYKSEYGIVISNSTSQITQDGKIIYVPYITFTLF
ncbi:MAG: ATP-binding protein [Methanosphaera stadtmanae]|jgi:hypothetical protein|nr:ATP-binding protein [Methanosphaera stadtmanae]